MSSEEITQMPAAATRGTGALLKGMMPWVLRAFGVYVLIVVILMIYWSGEPDGFAPVKQAERHASSQQRALVPGYVSVHSAISLGNTLLDKRGGYLSNDLLPPGVLMDNMPEWEFGVLQQLRDFTLALRNDFSRSQTQSQDDVDLREAHPLLSFSNDRWILPSTESQYRKAIGHLEGYLDRLSDDQENNAQFYARADNLVVYLQLVEKQLGSFSQRLSASVGQVRLNTDLTGDANARQSTPGDQLVVTRTPWLQIDNEFYEARGACFALIHLLKAIEHDFAPVLEDKNALVSLRQIIRELENTQDAIWSPIILNGRGFGFFANHSLVMANYISRASAALGDLRALLDRG
jgi:hypothetical protein